MKESKGVKVKVKELTETDIGHFAALLPCCLLTSCLIALLPYCLLPDSLRDPPEDSTPPPPPNGSTPLQLKLVALNHPSGVLPSPYHVQRVYSYVSDIR